MAEVPRPSMGEMGQKKPTGPEISLEGMRPEELEAMEEELGQMEVGADIEDIKRNIEENFEVVLKGLANEMGLDLSSPDGRHAYENMKEVLSLKNPDVQKVIEEVARKRNSLGEGYDISRNLRAGLAEIYPQELH